MIPEHTYGYAVLVHGGVAWGIFPNQESAVLWTEHQLEKGIEQFRDWKLVKVKQPTAFEL